MFSSHTQAHRNRIKTEMEMLRRLTSENQGSLEIEHQDIDIITLLLTVGSYVIRNTHSSQLSIASEHKVHISFIDSDEHSILFNVRLDPILFHPNIPPGGQWEVRYSHVVDFLYTLWDFYTYRQINTSADRTRNQQALNWYETEKPGSPSSKVLRRIVLDAPEEPIVRMIAPSEQVAQRPIGENYEHERPGVYEPNPSVPRPTEKQAQRPIAVTGADEGLQSSGFRVRSRIRVPQPLHLKFPRENWENGTRANYERWWYDVPQPHRMTHNPIGLKVIILEKSLRSILHHASGDIRNERFGILVGGFYQDPQSDEKWVEIVSMLPAERVRANIASVEVSLDEINRLNDDVDIILTETQGTIRKIGWYHTHPGHGIFMSSTDQSNQQLCYGADWQVAIVVDPIRKRYGAFYSSKCTPLYDGLLVFSDREAQHLQTPAYLAWRDLEKRGIVSSHPDQSLRENDAIVRQFVVQPGPVRTDAQVSIPPRQIDPQQKAISPPDEQPAATEVQQRPGEQLTTPSRHSDEQPSQQSQPGQERKDKDILQHVASVGKKILEDIGKRVLIPFLLLVTLGLIVGLIFTNIRSNGTPINTQAQSGKQIKAFQLQLEKDQRQLNDQNHESHNLQQKLYQTQQALFNQISSLGLKNTDPLMYRNLLKVVVGIDPSTDSGKKAVNALKDPLTYTIAQGDTLEGIAKEFGVSVKALKNANPDITPSAIHPDTTLKIPGITA